MTTRFHLISWRVHDRKFRDTVFVQARLVDDELEMREPVVLLDSLRKLEQTAAVPWLLPLTRLEVAFVEKMVLALEEREDLYPLTNNCLQCGHGFERCRCDEITQDLSVA